MRVKLYDGLHCPCINMWWNSFLLNSFFYIKKMEFETYLYIVFRRSIDLLQKMPIFLFSIFQINPINSTWTSWSKKNTMMAFYKPIQLTGNFTSRESPWQLLIDPMLKPSQVVLLDLSFIPLLSSMYTICFMCCFKKIFSAVDQL